MNFSWRMIAAVLGVVALLILIIVLIFGNKPKTNAPLTTKREVLTLRDYATRGAAVSYTVDGPVVAQENHRTVKITISSNVRSITVFTGYDGQVLKNQDLLNSETAFSEFLGALQTSNFTFARRNANPNLKLEGQCPLGKRIILDTVATPTDTRLWATSCAPKGGTFGGTYTVIGKLFQSQIPNYGAFLSGTSASQ